MGDLKTGVELEFHLLNPTSMEIADQSDCSRCMEIILLHLSDSPSYLHPPDRPPDTILLYDRKGRQADSRERVV